jgi:hypothetical protein
MTIKCRVFAIAENPGALACQLPSKHDVVTPRTACCQIVSLVFFAHSRARTLQDGVVGDVVGGIGPVGHTLPLGSSLCDIAMLSKPEE